MSIDHYPAERFAKNIIDYFKARQIADQMYRQKKGSDARCIAAYAEVKRLERELKHDAEYCLYELEIQNQ